MMEELLIKYLENNCTAEEKKAIDALFADKPSLKSEMEAIKKMDGFFSNKFKQRPDPVFVAKLKAIISKSYEKKSDYKDFIVPGFFIIGSVVYMLINLNSIRSNDATIDIESYNVYFNLGFIALTGMLMLYFVDYLLSHKKKNNSIKLFSL